MVKSTVLRGNAARLASVLVIAVCLGLGACSSAPSAPGTDRPAATPTPAPMPARIGDATAAPQWLGTRVLAVGPNGFAPAQDTPPELRNRSIITVDELPPPSDGQFHATVQAVPADVLARSSWSKDMHFSANGG